MGIGSQQNIGQWIRSNTPLANSTELKDIINSIKISEENPNLDSRFDNTKNLNLVFWYELCKGN